MRGISSVSYTHLDVYKRQTCILIAIGLRDVAFSGIGEPVLRVLFHAFYKLLQHAFFGAHLFARNEPPEIVHIEQGADTEHGSKKARCFADAAAFDVESQIGGDEPVIKLKLVLLNPGIYFIDGHAGIPKVSQTIHNKPRARGRAKGGRLYTSCGKEIDIV